MPKIPGVNDLEAVRALEKAGFAIIRQGSIELGQISVEVPRDPGDAPILATLATAKADVLVTGDGDLLALRDKYPIETPAEFVRCL